MSEGLEDVQFTREDRQRYRDKLRDNLAALRTMLAEGRFETGRDLIGVEMEFYVVDADGEPVSVNAELLDRIASEDFQTELAQFNIEFNLPPRRSDGDALSGLEKELGDSLEHASRRAGELDARIAMIGIMPTLDDLHLTVQNLSSKPRYHLLNEQILAARGEDLTLDIEGPESLRLTTGSITIEAAATSVQLHLEVAPEELPATWNAAQAVAAPEVAVGCNSPYLLGRELWRETRIALFRQAIDTRTEELMAQGVRPRVWFGERWVEAPIDLFEENVTYFPALLPLMEDEDPEQVLADGGVPSLPELTLHNGTIWRWNRPVYGVADDTPHLRVENRVLPAGPTLTDTVANAAFYYGLVWALKRMDPPISDRMSFATATENFWEAARHGLGARLRWPGEDPQPARRLILDRLLPMAHDGLAAGAVSDEDRERYLGVIAERAERGQTGADWQVGTVHELAGEGLDRSGALREMTRRYLEHMATNEPVHTWPRAGGG